MVSSGALCFFFTTLVAQVSASNNGTHNGVNSIRWISGPDFNSTHDGDRMMCAFQLSGNYCVMNRALYYALIFFSVIGHSHVWLVAGALASALTYSSTAAIHAVVLAGATSNGIFDIDMLGTWAIVSVACMAVLPIFTLSSAIRESVFSPVFGFWGTLVAIGAICDIITFTRSYPAEPACLSMAHNPQLLTNPGQLADPSFNCTYACFSRQQMLRTPSELIALPTSRAFGHFNILLTTIFLTAILGLASAFFGFCLPTDRKRTEAELNAAIRRNPARDGDLPKVRRAKAAARRAAFKELETGEYAGNSCEGICWSLFSCVGLLVVVVLNEVFLLAYEGGFPYNEQPFAIGQWGSWVGVLLALLAAALVKWREPKWRERQDLLAKEKEAFDRKKEVMQRARQYLEQSNSPVNNDASVTVPANEDRSQDQVKNVTTLEMEAGTDQTPAIFGTAEMAGEVAPQRPTVPEMAKARSRTSQLADAAANGDLEAVRTLVKTGTNVNGDGTDLAPLVRAAWAGREEIVRFLVEEGAEIASREGHMAWTRARANRHDCIAKFLEEHGAASWTDSATGEDTRTKG